MFKSYEYLCNFGNHICVTWFPKFFLILSINFVRFSESYLCQLLVFIMCIVTRFLLFVLHFLFLFGDIFMT